jgi:hypothetical protein
MMQTRRRFLLNGAAVVMSVPLVSLLVTACTQQGSDSLPAGQAALSESDATAQALGYKQNGSEVDVSKFPKKNSSADQKCQNCAQYTALNSGWGKCNIFPQGAVKSTGWCNTWTAKQNAASS